MLNRSKASKEAGPKMAPEPYSFLPEIEFYPLDPEDPPTQGWWIDPLSSNGVTQRYNDGAHWTPYIAVRTPGMWTDIFSDGVNTEVDPDAIGIPRPPAAPYFALE